MTRKSPRNPSILIVDDAPESVQQQFSLLAEDAEAVLADVLHPADLEADQLQDANLILVDYRLDNWPERDSHASLAMKPETGLSLAMVLRDHLDRSAEAGSTAIALHTALLNEIRGRRLAAKTAHHVVAQLNNLEWIFEKPGTSQGSKFAADQFNEMVLLARAVQELPSRWPNCASGSIDEVRRLLDMDREGRSFTRCWREVLECQVPVHELTAQGHGIRFVRWILHQILPYPTFLRDRNWVAARLEITVDALQEVLDDGRNRLAKDLDSMRYTGILSRFLGERWWCGALEDYAWELVGGGTGHRENLHHALSELAGSQLCRTVPNPVVCLNADLQPDTEFAPPSEAVRLRPDHWPAFADFAWTKRTTLRGDASLETMVDPYYMNSTGDEPDE